MTDTASVPACWGFGIAKERLNSSAGNYQVGEQMPPVGCKQCYAWILGIARQGEQGMIAEEIQFSAGSKCLYPNGE